MKSRSLLLLLGLFSLAALAAGGFTFWAKGKVEPALQKKLAEACPRCTFRWESFSIGPRGVSFKNLEYASEPGQVTVLSVKARELDLRLSWRQALREVIDLRAVYVTGAEVKVMEIEGHGPASPPPTALFAVRKIDCSDCAFTYEIREKGKLGRISLDSIHASISAFGTLPELRDQRVEGRAEARLEQSGKVNLLVDAILFRPEPDVKVQLSLTGQNLAGVNNYFLPIDGVELEGRILTGHASADLQGDFLSAWAAIRYEDFDIHFRRTKERGGLKALISNIVADLKLDAESEARGGKAVGVRRKKQESIVSFILRGMKEAALRVASS